MKPIQCVDEEYRWLDSSKLFASNACHRFEQSKVDDIVKNYDPLKFTPPVVSFRNGKFFVLDGQHMITALKVFNGGKDVAICCRVYYGLTEADESTLI